MDITVGDSFAPSANTYSQGRASVQDSYDINYDKSTFSSKVGQRGSNGKDRDKSSQTTGGSEDTLELSPEAIRMLESLKSRDKAVRAHEAAHLSAAGGIAKGGAQFTLQRGPDGNSYAVGGEVSIDASAVPNDPQATIAKARQVVAAALAPSDPSPQDRAVAANARQMEANAAAELAKKINEQSKKEPSVQEPSVQGMSAQGRQATSAYSTASSLKETTDPIAMAYQAVA